MRLLVVSTGAEVGDSFLTGLQPHAVVDLVRGTQPRTAIRAAEGFAPELVLVDLDSSPSVAVAIVGRLHRRWPKRPIAVLSEASDARGTAMALAVLQAGASSWLRPSTTPCRLVAALQETLDGQGTFPVELLHGAVETLVHEREELRERWWQLATLSLRQREILQLMVDGLSRPAIARQLGLSPHTVRTQIQRIFDKLQVHSAIEAVAVGRSMFSPDSRRRPDLDAGSILGRERHPGAGPLRKDHP
jgi:DNA-binding NarL/FixJ family response regulator